MDKADSEAGHLGNNHLEILVWLLVTGKENMFQTTLYLFLSIIFLLKGKRRRKNLV